MSKEISKYRTISFWLIILATIPIGIDRNIYSLLLSSIILLLAFLISRKYKCQHCGYIFDVRLSKKKINICPKYSKKL